MSEDLFGVIFVNSDCCVLFTISRYPHTFRHRYTTNTDRKITITISLSLKERKHMLSQRPKLNIMMLFHMLGILMLFCTQYGNIIWIGDTSISRNIKRGVSGKCWDTPNIVGDFLPDLQVLILHFNQVGCIVLTWFIDLWDVEALYLSNNTMTINEVNTDSTSIVEKICRT